MGRTQFWLWIGTLFALSALASMVQSLLWGELRGTWSSLQNQIDSNAWAKDALGKIGIAWPQTLALTPFPLGFIGFKTTTVLPLMPLMLAINFFAITPVVRRARDAGYSPLWTVTLLYWSVIGTVLIVAISQALAVSLGWNAVYVLMATTIYLSKASQAVSTLAALAAIYFLAAPTKSGPNPSEVTP